MSIVFHVMGKANTLSGFEKRREQMINVHSLFELVLHMHATF